MSHTSTTRCSGSIRWCTTCRAEGNRGALGVVGPPVLCTRGCGRSAHRHSGRLVVPQGARALASRDTSWNVSDLRPSGGPNVGDKRGTRPNGRPMSWGCRGAARGGQDQEGEGEGSRIEGGSRGNVQCNQWAMSSGPSAPQRWYRRGSSSLGSKLAASLSACNFASDLALSPRFPGEICGMSLSAPPPDYFCGSHGSLPGPSRSPSGPFC